MEWVQQNPATQHVEIENTSDDESACRFYKLYKCQLQASLHKSLRRLHSFWPFYH